MASETWYDIFKRELAFYNDEWAEDEDLLNALCEIAESA